MIDLSVLLAMFIYARPTGSPVESAFIDRFIAPLPGAIRDSFGNWHVQIGDELQPILWSCHTDTVHRDSRMQTVSYRDDRISLSHKSKRKHASCLGADDTAGVFLCHQMIAARVLKGTTFSTPKRRLAATDRRTLHNRILCRRPDNSHAPLP